MRIIAGSARGRRFDAPEGRNTRPTLDRVKEAMFGMIQFDIENTQVLDKKIHHEGKQHEIRVVLIGQEVPEASIAIARSKMKDYKLDNTKLVVLQGMNNESARCFSEMHLRCFRCFPPKNAAFRWFCLILRMNPIFIPAR